MRNEWKLFGWQHFRLSIPSNWDMVEERGHEEKGYCKFDDLNHTKLEIRWEPYKGGKDFLVFITNYAKKVKWHNASIRSLLNSENHYYIENNENNVRQIILFYHNPKISKRVIALRFFLVEENQGLKRFNKISKSLQEDYTREKSLWCFYDHNYELPTVYRKISANLNVGHKKIIYARRNKMILCWSISLAKTFCPHKPFSNDSMNRWIPELIKTEFKKEINLPELLNYLDQEVFIKTSLKGRLLLKNIFHLNHKWVLTAHYSHETDTLHIAMANYFTDKSLKLLSPFKNLVKFNV